MKARVAHRRVGVRLGAVALFAAGMLAIQSAAVAAAVTFDSEVVRLFVQTDTLRVEGEYHFTLAADSRAVRGGRLRLFYPYPEDSRLGTARTLRLEARMPGDAAWQTQPFRERADGRGVSWDVSIARPVAGADGDGADVAVVVRTVYEQLLLQRFARYIVTTTSAWRRPLQRARFEIRLPPGARPTRFSHPFILQACGDDSCHVFETTDFLPERDIEVEWSDPTRRPAVGVRPAAVAGRFYPEDAGRLRGAVAAFLDHAVPSDGKRPLALVAPHAGYIYSGQIAADAWRQAADFDYDLVVVLGTNHTTAPFDGVSVYDGEGYRTPLGVARIDGDVVGRLLAADRSFAFRPAVHASEHSVEVQVPFAQVLFPDVPLVAAIVGSDDPDVCRRFANALASAVAGRRVLLVASTDLSHYPAYEDAVAADTAVLRSIAAVDLERADDSVRQAIARELKRGRPGLSTCACGAAPLLTLLAAGRELGATRSSVVSYANSGDTALGDRQRVVGYGAVVLTEGSAASDAAGLSRTPGSKVDSAIPDLLSATEETALLAFARETVASYLTTETTPLARDFPSAAWDKRGAFVTLHKGGELRGCIGHMAADRPLCQVVGAMALQAACNDQRFRPVQAAELAEVRIEISALTPYERVSGPDAIRVGIDGVLLRKGERSAVYLPQVALEQGWSRDEMLDHLCLKAGLARGDWRHDVQLWTFQAHVFAEDH